MRILITGAGGFIGSFLTSYFDNYQTVAFTSAQFDFTDTEKVNNLFDNNKFDAVINCAARGRYAVQDKDESILSTNLKIFMNLLANQHKFSKLINIGTGAEFGINTDINLAREDDIFNCLPEESYGLSKNIISRIVRETENFHTVRLFGCFDSSEPEKRLLSGFRAQVKDVGYFTLNNDRFADFVSAKDLAHLIDMIAQGQVTVRDVNMVYKEKYRLSDILVKYCRIHDIDPAVVRVESSTDRCYTGSSEIISSLGIEFQGMDAALKEYSYA